MSTQQVSACPGRPLQIASQKVSRSALGVCGDRCRVLVAMLPPHRLTASQLSTAASMLIIALCGPCLLCASTTECAPTQLIYYLIAATVSDRRYACSVSINVLVTVLYYLFCIICIKKFSSVYYVLSVLKLY